MYGQREHIGLSVEEVGRLVGACKSREALHSELFRLALRAVVRAAGYSDKPDRFWGPADEYPNAREQEELRLLASPDFENEAALHQQTRDALVQALVGLTEAAVKVVLLRQFEGLSNQRVAERLGLTASGSKTQYHRAFRIVKRKLSVACEAGGRERGVSLCLIHGGGKRESNYIRRSAPDDAWGGER